MATVNFIINAKCGDFEARLNLLNKINKLFTGVKHNLISNVVAYYSQFLSGIHKQLDTARVSIEKERDFRFIVFADFKHISGPFSNLKNLNDMEFKILP